MTSKNLPALDDLADRINAEHKAVCEAAMTATQHAIKCGTLLMEAKSGLPHGQWLPWLKENCGLSERATQAYMRLARRHEELDGAEAQRVADLPVRQAMIAIVDHRGEQTPDILNKNEPPSRDEIWAWATRQVNGPFNRVLAGPLRARERTEKQFPLAGSLLGRSACARGRLT